MLTLQIDDGVLESVVYRAVKRALADHASSADHLTEVPKTSATATDYLISSRVKADVLKYIHAPDTQLGARREPHWVVASKIREGDRVLFRDALDKAIVGCGIAHNPRRGEHPRDHLPAVIVDVVEAVRFPRPIPDSEFIKIFMEHSGNRAFKFPLITSRGQFYRKTYAYHLKAGIFDAIVAAASGA